MSPLFDNIKLILFSILFISFSVSSSADNKAPLVNDYMSYSGGNGPYSSYSHECRNIFPKRALIDDDVYSYFDIENEYLTPLKKKLFEDSDEFQEKKKAFREAKMQALETICCLNVYNYNSQIYDLDRGGFNISLQKPFNLGLVVPLNLENKISKDLKFFMPISNLMEASKIEDKKDYGFLILFDYFPVSESKTEIPTPSPQNNQQKPKSPVSKYAPGITTAPQRRKKTTDNLLSEEIEVSSSADLMGLNFMIRDILLYKKSTGEVVWSAISGDWSQKLKEEKVSDNEDININNELLEEGVDRIIRSQDGWAEGDSFIYTNVDQDACFPGGARAMMNYLSCNVNYPQAAADNGIQGRVIVKFVVEKDGSIGNVTVVKGVDRDLDKEAIRVVKKMPKWQPGKINGVPVRSFFNLPITFKLSN